MCTKCLFILYFFFFFQFCKTTHPASALVLEVEEDEYSYITFSNTYCYKTNSIDFCDSITTCTQICNSLKENCCGFFTGQSNALCLCHDFNIFTHEEGDYVLYYPSDYFNSVDCSIIFSPNVCQVHSSCSWTDGECQPKEKKVLTMAIILGLGLGIPFILCLICGYYFYDKKLKLEIKIEKNEIYGGEELDSTAEQNNSPDQNNNIADITTPTPTPQIGEPELLWDGIPSPTGDGTWFPNSVEGNLAREAPSLEKIKIGEQTPRTPGESSHFYFGPDISTPPTGVAFVL